MAMLGLCSFVFSMFFLLLCHGDTFVVTQGNVTQLTCCARFVNGIGVNHPAIVREIPHFDVFPAFFPERPAFLASQIFLQVVIIVGARKELCA